MILVWMVINHPGNAGAFDPYPWILLNLCMSTQAMYTGPVVMVSQNRQEAAMALQRKHMEDMLVHIETLDGRLEQEVELFNIKLDLIMKHLNIFPLVTAEDEGPGRPDIAGVELGVQHLS